jgi:hypothetical protein
MVLIAATGAAVTFALLLLVINNLGAKPPGALGERLVILLLPAEIIGETFGTRAPFLMAGFLESFFRVPDRSSEFEMHPQSPRFAVIHPRSGRSKQFVPYDRGTGNRPDAPCFSRRSGLG